MLAQKTHIEDSILSRCSLLDGVQIKEKSILNNTMVGRNSTIGKNCRLTNVVVDHDSVIPDGTVLDDVQWPLQ
jgi:ADP-glucose pyrophosphorylase